MTYFTVVDLGRSDGSRLKGGLSASPESWQPDYTVAYFCEVDDGVCRVKDCLFGRWNSPNAGLYLFRWTFDKQYFRWPIFLEGCNADDVAVHIRSQATAIKFDIQIIPMDNQADAKLRRGRDLHAAIQAGRIRVDLPEWMDAHKILKAELRAYPKPANGRDDFRDALSLVCVVMDGQIVAPVADVRLYVNSDVEPSPMADPGLWSRWLRQKEENGGGDTGGNDSGVCM